MPNRYSADPYTSQYPAGSPQANGYSGMQSPAYQRNVNQQSTGRGGRSSGAQAFGQAADEWRQVLTGYMRPSGNPTRKAIAPPAATNYVPQPMPMDLGGGGTTTGPLGGTTTGPLGGTTTGPLGGTTTGPLDMPPMSQGGDPMGAVAFSQPQVPQMIQPSVPSYEVPIRVQRVAEKFFGGDMRAAQQYLSVRGVL